MIIFYSFKLKQKFADDSRNGRNIFWNFFPILVRLDFLLVKTLLFFFHLIWEGYIPYYMKFFFWTLIHLQLVQILIFFVCSWYLLYFFVKWKRSFKNIEYYIIWIDIYVINSLVIHITFNGYRASAYKLKSIVKIRTIE